MKGKIMKKRMKSKALGLSILLTAGCILTACNPNNSTLNTTLTENPSADLTVVSDFNDSEIITSEIITSEINPSEELPSDELPFSDAGPKGILGESGTIGDYEYTLQGSDTEGPNLERGWYIMRSDGNPVLIMISSGRRNTGGYSINIKDIGEAPKTDDSDASTLQITVEETSPAEGQITTEALTNPVCYIGFNTDPGMLSVKNQNGVELEYKGEWGFEIEVEDGYIAVFENGGGEIMEKTYVYEDEETGRYKYVNVTATTVQYGGPEWKETAKGSGYVDTMDDIIAVAKKNGSCGFVMIPEDPGKPYSIEEYQSYLESAKKK